MAAGQRGDFATARRATAAAEELFAARGDVEGRAGVARCGWRMANHHAAAGAPGEAFAVGQRAIEAWAAVVEESDAAAWRREMVRACADVSVFAVLAGRHDDAVALASRGVEVARTARTKGLDLSRDMQTELGTALHNLAAAHSARAVSGGPPTGDSAREDLRAALKAADEEIRLRKTLAPVAQPDLATWELASGMSQRGRIRMVAGEMESARYDLRDARELAARLGPAGEGIVREATRGLQQLGGL